MAKSVMIVYEPLSKIKEKKSYWECYVSFYEMYWDGPSTPKSAWFGREYDDFKDALSKHLDVDINEIEDCFFIKDENEEYFICPLKPSSFNILVTKNIIPESWFVLFREDERKFFYTHTGFGAIDLDGIYYKTSSKSSQKRIKKATDLIYKTLRKLEKSNTDVPLLSILSKIQNELNDLANWLSGFEPDSILLLNFGEISSLIHPQTFKNENTAMEIWEFLSLLEGGKFDEANLKLNLIKEKWGEIERKASGEIDKSMIQ